MNVRPISRRSLGRLAGGLAVLISFGNKRKTGRATGGTWSTYAPLTTSCASDYSGHQDNALDFGGSGGTAVHVYLKNGPYVGWARAGTPGASCSSMYFTWHKRVPFDLYDDSASVLISGGVASHVTTDVQNGNWIYGDGGTIAWIAAGDPNVAQPPSDCWSAVHAHYGALTMTKAVSWGLCGGAPTAGKTVCWSKTI